MSEPIDFTLWPHKDFLKRAKDFINTYEIADMLMPGDDRFKALKKKNERKCRFCRRLAGEVTFSDVAHLIPESLGNKELLSDFECDECNKFLGKYDSELSQFLGIHRTLTFTKGKGKIPTYKSAGETLEARSHKIFGDDSIVISREDSENGSISFDKESGRMTLSFINNAFIPLKVYKSILKIALSTIDEKEIESDYRLMIDFLMDDTIKINSGLIINGYAISYNHAFRLPHGYLFKKKERSSKVHTHVFALYYQNMIFCLPVPLNKNDDFFFDKTQTIRIPIYPPLFPHPDTSALTPRFFQEDFSNDQKVPGAEEEIVFEMSPEELKSSIAYDSKTGETFESEFNPSEIVKIVLRNIGGPVDIKEMAEKLK